MARHTTARGEPIDIGALIAQNAQEPALGNAKMNARGDILGDKGIVLKTQEQIEADWEAEKAKQKLLAGKPGNLKAPLETMVDPTQVAPKNLTADKDFEPEINQLPDGHLIGEPIIGRPDVAPQTQKPTRRKIVETE